MTDKGAAHGRANRRGPRLEEGKGAALIPVKIVLFGFAAAVLACAWIIALAKLASRRNDG